MSKVLKCTEFTSDNAFKPLDGRLKEPEAPDDFVDNTVYRYKLMPDGTKKFLGTMEGYPEGWDTPKYAKQGRVARRKKEETEKVGRRQLNWEELDPKILELRKNGMYLKNIATELGIGHATVHRRLKVLEQAKEPVTEPTAKLETVAEEAKPATESITDLEEQEKFYCDDTDFAADDEPIPYVLCEDKFSSKEAIRIILRTRFNIAEEIVLDLIVSPLAIKIVKDLIEMGAI